MFIGDKNTLTQEWKTFTYTAEISTPISVENMMTQQFIIN